MAQFKRKQDRESGAWSPLSEGPTAPKLTVGDLSQRPEDERWFQRVLPPLVAAGVLGALVYFAGLLATIIVVGSIVVGLFILLWNVPDP